MSMGACPRCWDEPCTCGYSVRTVLGKSPREIELVAAATERRIRDLEDKVSNLLARVEAIEKLASIAGESRLKTEE